jgi:hypothetical protein
MYNRIEIASICPFSALCIKSSMYGSSRGYVSMMRSRILRCTDDLTLDLPAIVMLWALD